MSQENETIEVEEVVEEEVIKQEEASKEFTVTIMISDKNLSYKSDFNEAETVFWLESVKALILKRAFDAAGENN
jgi:hypothetical protein